uniref:Uncharacterized protein n=1 Tax=Siphoviridae sp. ctiuX7 TaxID=2826436 RepID=A0A8S5N1I1_9CAUD|nr:MAG TPA: hypothetical protein [Siphoviridae sp. ctiuX7]DAP08062.1 MAG TPA: hypothetical protein [Caudoviricetes sp.]
MPVFVTRTRGTGPVGPLGTSSPGNLSINLYSHRVYRARRFLAGRGSA